MTEKKKEHKQPEAPPVTFKESVQKVLKEYKEKYGTLPEWAKGIKLD